MRHELLTVGKLIGGPMGEVERFLKTLCRRSRCGRGQPLFCLRRHAQRGLCRGQRRASRGRSGPQRHRAETAVDVEDTNGKLVIEGKDIRGYTISEEIIPDAGVTIQGVKAFSQITSITGVGWAQGGTGPDTIVIGFGDVVGLPDVLLAASDAFLVAMGTALLNAPTVAVGAAPLPEHRRCDRRERNPQTEGDLPDLNNAGAGMPRPLHMAFQRRKGKA